MSANFEKKKEKSLIFNIVKLIFRVLFYKKANKSKKI